MADVTEISLLLRGICLFFLKIVIKSLSVISVRLAMVFTVNFVVIIVLILTIYIS